MDIRPVTDDYSVSGQIAPGDVSAIAAEGFRSIVCNRPDGEQPGQPDHGQIEAAARDAGLAFRYIPVLGSGMTQDNVADMAVALRDLPGPVFAYCRSGARSTNIYMAARQSGG